jgi:hypothetical protein
MWSDWDFIRTSGTVLQKIPVFLGGNPALVLRLCGAAENPELAHPAKAGIMARTGLK